MRTMERRNLELEQKFRKQFTRRCWFFLFVTILLYLILASRFAYLQIFQYDELVTKGRGQPQDGDGPSSAPRHHHG